MSDFSELEQKAIELIKEEDEILQSDLWKEIDCSAGKGSEIARKLADENIIDRERVTANGTSTFMLKARRKNPEELDFSLLLAGDMLPPFIGGEELEHRDDLFTQWVLNLEQDYPEE